MSSNWDKNLTEKLKYLLLLKPLLAFRDFRIADEELKDSIQHYDPLAIVLKIIEIIIDNTTIRVDTATAGITREALFTKVQEFLVGIDSENGREIPEDVHREFFTRLLDKMYSQGSQTHQEWYIDYSEHPPKKRRLDFELLYTETSWDGEVQIFAHNSLINMFAKILDLNLEDLQQATLYILRKQIERGDLENAVQTARSNTQMSLSYFNNIQDIIETTKRNYLGTDWEDEYPKQLETAQSHILQCQKAQKQQSRELMIRYSEITDDRTVEYHWLAELRTQLSRSWDMLTILDTQISHAHKTFLDEQLPQTFTLREIEEAEDIENILVAVGLQNMTKNEEIVEVLRPYFANIRIPRINSMYNTLNILLKEVQDRESVHRYVRAKKKFIPKVDLRVFPDQIRREALSYLDSIFEKQPSISLSRILELAEDGGMADLHTLYLCLFIQGRYAIDNFEVIYYEKKLEFELGGRFSVGNFTGIDILVTRRSNNE